MLDVLVKVGSWVGSSAEKVDGDGATAVVPAPAVAPQGVGTSVTVIHGVWNELGLIVFLALWVVFAVSLIRALPWPKSMLEKKPLACDVCMTGWMAILQTVAFALWIRPWLLYAVPASSVALILLAVLAWLQRGSSLPEGLIE